MSEKPSYKAPAGHRWGTGSASVLRYLLADLARKPGHAPAVAHRGTAPRITC